MDQITKIDRNPDFIAKFLHNLKILFRPNFDWEKVEFKDFLSVQFTLFKLASTFSLC